MSLGGTSTGEPVCLRICVYKQKFKIGFLIILTLKYFPQRVVSEFISEVHEHMHKTLFTTK